MRFGKTKKSDALISSSAATVTTAAAHAASIIATLATAFFAAKLVQVVHKTKQEKAFQHLRFGIHNAVCAVAAANAFILLQHIVATKFYFLVFLKWAIICF